MVVGGIVCSVIAVIVAVVATAVDGVSSAKFHAYKACVSPATKQIYGDPSYTAFLIATCEFGASSDADTLCYCVNSSKDACWEYDLSHSKSSCNDILTIYPDLLSTSFALCGVCLLLVFVYSIFTCVVGCKR